VTASLRVRIVALATVVVAVVLALTAVGVVSEARRRYVGELDRTLEQRAEQLNAEFVVGPDQHLVDSNAEDRFAQIVDATGTVLTSTSNLDTASPAVPPPSDRIEVTIRDDLPIEDDTYRVLTLARPDGGFVIVGENIDDVRDDVEVLIATLAVAFPLAVVTLAVAMWWIVGRTLRPVESIRVEVAGIGVDELDRRVAVPRSGDEIARLATTMNDMLARLDASVAQQRAFVANASHELRTPLTRLRTSLEVDLTTTEPDGELATTCHRALADTIAMQRLTDDLLFLARHDATDPTSRAARASPVDLDAVIDEQVRLAREHISPTIRITTPNVSPVVVTGSATGLGRAVSNLLSNALRHARHTVSISLHDNGTSAVLVIDDDGPGIPPTERERLFGRFVRLDTSRGPTDGGAGLGLAIVREVIAAHGGTVTLDESPMRGTRATITIPHT